MEPRGVPPVLLAWPSDEARKRAFEDYTLAVGKVAYAWNYLHEKLAGLFASVTKQEAKIAFSVWYSTTSDRTQRKMLEAAINARATPQLQEVSKFQDLKWMMGKCNELCHGMSGG